MSEAEHALFAFVLMPFSENLDDIYRLGIKEPATTLVLKPNGLMNNYIANRYLRGSTGKSRSRILSSLI